MPISHGVCKQGRKTGSTKDGVKAMRKKETVTRAERICRGKYKYKGYILFNYGYYPPDGCIWWEATNIKTGCADYHAHTKRELIRMIDTRKK